MLERYRHAFMNTPDAPAGGTPAPTPAAPPAPAQPALPPELAALISNPEAFKKRLDEAGESAQRKLMKDLGVKDAEELKAKLAEGKKLADEKLTEQERAKKQIDELAPQAKLAETRGKTITKYLAAEEAAIPEDKKGLLDLAPPSEQPEARLEWIANAKAKGLFASTPAAPAAPAAKPPAPATNTPPPGPSPTPPAGGATPQDTYDRMMRSGREIAAAGLAQLHPEINRTAWKKQSS